MSKAQNKQSGATLYEKEENARHVFKVQKKKQDNKMMKNLDKVLRNKDYDKLVRMEDF